MASFLSSYRSSIKHLTLNKLFIYLQLTLSLSLVSIFCRWPRALFHTVHRNMAPSSSCLRTICPTFKVLRYYSYFPFAQHSSFNRFFCCNFYRTDFLSWCIFNFQRNMVASSSCFRTICPTFKVLWHFFLQILSFKWFFCIFFIEQVFCLCFTECLSIILLIWLRRPLVYGQIVTTFKVLRYPLYFPTDTDNFCGITGMNLIKGNIKENGLIFANIGLCFILQMLDDNLSYIIASNLIFNVQSIFDIIMRALKY